MALAAAVGAPGTAEASSRVFTEPDHVPDLNLPELRSGENLFDFIDARSQQKDVSSPVSSKKTHVGREFESLTSGPPPTEAEKQKA